MTETSSTISGGAWLEWGGTWGPLPCAALLLLVSLAWGYLWWRQSRGMGGSRRAWLTALRVSAMALFLFLLFQPVMVRPIYEKSTDVVAVLFDDSASMMVKDGNGTTRAERLRKALSSSSGEFDTALNSRFHVLNYRFNALARPLEGREQLNYEGRETRITDAIRQVARDTETLTVSAMVVLSDGGQQARPDPAALEALGNLDIPVYTVGVGEETWRDVAVGDIALSRGFFDDAPARITTQFSASGLSGQTVVVELVQNGVVQATEERVITNEQTEQQVVLETVPRERAWLDYTVRVRVKEAPMAGGAVEYVLENNEAAVLLDHREKHYRILYFSGRPNWQNKFVRHALAADPELQLSSLIRISGAEKKFVFRGEDTALGNPLFEGFEDDSTLPRYDEAVFTRLGLAEGELKDGYPVTREALYPFHLIIWGDIEADFFAPEHLRLTRDAVAERGASFLMLGGPRALASGEYDGTLIESMIPVLSGGVEPYDGASDEPASVIASPEGFLTGVWALNSEAGANAQAWDALPELPAHDTITSPRIGASVLALVKESTAGTSLNTPSPFLLWHTFGHGKSALLGTGETWPWHMQTEAGNEAHERVWRQLVRSLVSSVPEAVSLEADPHVFVEGSDGKLIWTVRDKEFERVEGASLQVRIVDPAGESTSVPLVERLELPGTYEATLNLAAPGKHGLILEGSDAGGAAMEPVEDAILVRADSRELDDARFDPTVLETIAKTTGGQYFALDALPDVAEAIVPSEREYAKLDRTPIWHHPAFYAVLIGLLCSEWLLRRRWGKA